MSQSSVKPGDRVRVLLSKNIHAKGTKQKFSREIFSVVSVAQVNARLSNGRKVRIERLLKVKEEEQSSRAEGRRRRRTLVMLQDLLQNKRETIHKTQL